MWLNRFRREKAAAVPATLSAFGKLPFFPEYLRCGLDSPAAGHVVDLLETAHAETVAAAGAREGTPEVRGILTLDDGATTVSLLVRPSTDAKGRRYPMCVFGFHHSEALRRRWHLVPMWSEQDWALLAATAWSPEVTDAASLDRALAGAVVDPPEPEGVARRFDETGAASVAGPWSALTGADGEPAQAMGLKLALLADAAAEADDAYGLALRVSYSSATAAASVDPAVRTALWLRLLTAWFRVPRPWPAVVEAVDPATGSTTDTYFFARPLTGLDLAHIRSGVGAPAIENLGEAWEEAPSQLAQRRLRLLLDAAPRPTADLWAAEAS